ncbi:MAG: MFS transporter [Spirochaetia bacterium]|nr:MFS transporter [Spirochaetia bacterium]
MKEKILTRNFCFCFLALLSISMVMFMLIATVTQYATEFGAAASLAGLVSGMYVLGGMFSRLAAGNLLERFGWKRVALFAAAFHFAACCFYLFVNNLYVFIIARFLHGMGFGVTSCAIVTIGMSILPKSRFGEAGGYFMMGTTISVGIGPFIGGHVYDAFGSGGCFLCAMIMSFLTWLFMFFVELRNADADPSSFVHERKKEPFIRRIIEPDAILASSVTGLTALGYVGIMAFYRIYAVETGLERAFSYFFLLYAGLLLFFRPMAGKIQDRYGNKYVCIPGIIAQTVGLILLSLRPCVVTLVICAVGCAMGYGSLNSACNVIVCRRAPASRRSYAVTTFYLCCDVAMGIGPAVLGAVASLGGYHVMYYFGSVITLAALPVFFLSEKQH